jgi:hypothetical protein
MEKKVQPKDLKQFDQSEFNQLKPYKKLNTLLFFTSIIFPYYLAKGFLPAIEESFPERTTRIYFIVNSFQTVGLLFCIIFYSLLYYYNFKFFQQYKSNNTPWPWETDKEKWKTTLKKLILVYFINLLISDLAQRFFYSITKASAESHNYPSL